MSAVDADPFLRVLSGTPTPAELAAVVTALLALAGAPGAARPPGREPAAAPVWALPEGASRPEVSWTT
ncbi:acyl-CoA carboxylase subunit epsilon [Streptomyces sp. NBC_00435]|uniref:acyl-CoA carboxylase epsilon subunit n=1 Tax=Streptomyces sp. NBC_00435 TaxID=2903649 RepID=UPI002E217C80